MKKKVTQMAGKAMAGMMAFALVAGSFQPLTAKAADDDIRVIPKFDTAPVIDGTISDGEWGEAAFKVALGEDNVILADGVDTNEFTADVYLGYDSTHVYIGIEAQYPEHQNEEFPDGLWANDCIQLQIGDSAANRNELGFALNSSTNESMTWAWASTAKDGYNMEAGKDYIVSREGDKTVYEIALGVEQFSKELESLEDGSSILFSMLCHTGGKQGEGNSSVIEWGEGIWVNGKDLSKAPLFALGKVPATFDQKAVKATKFDSAPVIDGTINGEEWGDPAIKVELGAKNVFLADGVDTNEFTADVYFGYDSTHFYIGVEAQYPEHQNEEFPDGLWANDCIQLQIGDTAANRNELGFALNSSTNESMTWAWASTAKDTYNMEAGKDYIVTRDGDKTVYEIALGVEQFSKEIEQLEDGAELLFSMLFHTGGKQGEGNSSVIEWGEGIWVNGKDLGRANLIGLGVIPEAPAAPEPTATPEPEVTPEPEATPEPANEPADATDAPAPTDAPSESSGSNTVVIVVVVVVVIVVIAAVAVVMKKKKGNDGSAK